MLNVGKKLNEKEIQKVDFFPTLTTEKFFCANSLNRFSCNIMQCHWYIQITIPMPFSAYGTWQFFKNFNLVFKVVCVFIRRFLERKIISDAILRLFEREKNVFKKGICFTAVCCAWKLILTTEKVFVLPNSVARFVGTTYQKGKNIPN
jgi:hypothetical protein